VYFFNHHNHINFSSVLVLRAFFNEN
jgi:hypothetical protein